MSVISLSWLLSPVSLCISGQTGSLSYTIRFYRVSGPVKLSLVKNACFIEFFFGFYFNLNFMQLCFDWCDNCLVPLLGIIVVCWKSTALSPSWHRKPLHRKRIEYKVASLHNITRHFSPIFLLSLREAFTETLMFKRKEGLVGWKCYYPIFLILKLFLHMPFTITSVQKYIKIGSNIGWKKLIDDW